MAAARAISIVLPSLHGGGAERVAVNLANWLANRGYPVNMVLMSASGEFLNDLRPDVRVVDLKVRRLRGALFPLVQHLRKEMPLAMLACMWPLTVIALWANRLASANTRVVVAEHTTWSRTEIAYSALGRWQARATMHIAFPMADGVVAVSKGAADDLATFAGFDRHSIAVIYNPVVSDHERATATPSMPEGWCCGTHCRVLAVGSLKAMKDYPTLLSAFAQLLRSVDARLLILGEGVCRAELEDQCKQLGIEDNVFMPGFCKDPWPYYRHADLHVLSSSGEGLPTVIIEAMAAGTPVVSTDCASGPREILCDGEFGRLVPVGDATALAAAMEEELAAPHERFALQARAADFSIEKACKQYERVLVGN